MASSSESNNPGTLSINPKLYPLEAVYSAAYVFLDRAYIVLDGDPEKEIIVSINPKDGSDPEKLPKEFMNELLNYSDYIKRAEATRSLREMMLQRAIITNDPGAARSDEKEDEEFDKILDALDEDDDYLDDPEGIAIPWEEKYGKETSSPEDEKKE